MLKISPRPTRRTRAKYGGAKPSVESRLLAAYERLLEAGQSFASISIEQLAAEAGMARGTFYLHFRDKGELVARLLNQLTDEMVRSFGTWVDNAELATRKDVQAAVTGMIKSFKRHKAIIAAVRDTMISDPIVVDLYSKMVDKIAALAQKSIATVKRRELSRRGATEDVANLLTWSIALYCTHCIDKSASIDFDRVAKAFGYICNSSIFADEPHGRGDS
jgi:TetR/AcrR family transcriptional regulator, ethionamide resistance regulator